MPKIPWTPPERPPRTHIPEYVEPVEPCPTCVGQGVLWSVTPDGKREIECWVCKGSGERLPLPGADGDPWAVRDPFEGEDPPAVQVPRGGIRYSQGTHDPRDGHEAW